MKKDTFLQLFAGFLITGIFAILFMMFFKLIPPENKDLINIVLGVLIACLTTIKDFFFGSSQGSKDKTELLNSKN